MAGRKQQKIMPGFPREGKFETKEEVDAYFSSDRIQCLLCGRWFKNIGGNHMIHRHGITTDEYKEMYGLPWNRGLTGKRLYEKRQKKAKQLIADGIIKFPPGAPLPLKPGPRRPHQPFQRDFASKQGLAVHGLSSKYGREDFEAILIRMKLEQRILRDVCKDSDMPSLTAWHEYAKKDPGLKEKAREIQHKLPYSLQTRAHDRSPRFEKDCRRMYAARMSLKNIAEALGVSPMTVKHALKNDKSGETMYGKGGWNLIPTDYEQILTRMREQQRTLRDVCKDPDVPSINSWLRFLKKHPEMEEKYRQTLYTLPYDVQIRRGVYSPGFRDECHRMKAAGMKPEEIAKKLGVSVNAVNTGLIISD